MEILDQVPVEIKAEQVLNILHMEKNSRYSEIVQELIDQVQPVIRPKAIYDVQYVEHIDRETIEIAGVRFTSRILRVNLDDVGRVFPFIATSGMEAESIDIPDDDLMGKFIVDTIKEISLGAAAHYLDEHIKNKYKISKMSAMNPGSLEDWPISQQKPLFSVFGDVEELIGVKLTDSFLMIPIKSISGIHFPTEKSFASCQLCQREKCPNRRAKFDPEMMKKYE
ncbi:MAG: hypothetical protein QG641_575 [Candidatus Poribacteria bacterium]|nr:hypothetical protein [Candidatus Poribacteria bacterium]MDQ1327295.1 hypothetical protein [Candidatus Poribacteria bacterium]